MLVALRRLVVELPRRPLGRVRLRKRSAAGKGGAATKGGRTPRKVQPPSWNRALKRGLIWGAVLTVLLAFGLGSKTSNVEARILAPTP